MFFNWIIGYLLVSLLLWTILKALTQNSRFRKPASPNEQQAARSSYPWLLNVIIAATFLLPFIPAYPAPNVGNWGAMLTRTSILIFVYGILSLACWIRMAVRPTLLTLYLAINGMILCGLSVLLLLLVGGASLGSTRSPKLIWVLYEDSLQWRR